MVSALQQLGVQDAFNPGIANFSGMTNQYKLSIGDIQHQANINVDEYGTEASAATVTSMMSQFVMDNVIEFNCNRPFMFVIHDTINYNVLFIGKFTGPSILMNLE
jgi:serpin B